MSINQEVIDKLTSDSAFMGQIMKRALEDPDVIKDLAKEIADGLSDSLEEDPKFKERIVAAALKDAKFRERLLEEVSKEMN